jgi:hypothetical protein
MINVHQSFPTIKVTFITKCSLIKTYPTFIKRIVLKNGAILTPKTNYPFIKKLDPLVMELVCLEMGVCYTHLRGKFVFSLKAWPH